MRSPHPAAHGLLAHALASEIADTLGQIHDGELHATDHLTLRLRDAARALADDETFVGRALALVRLRVAANDELPPDQGSPVIPSRSRQHTHGPN